jgi:hypothetical protein
MCLKSLCACAAVLLLSATGLCAAGNYVVPTTTLAAQTSNNTSAANSFVSQTNGNLGSTNISKVDVHTLLYPGTTTKVYAHLMVWFGGSNHMNVGYSSTDPAQVHNQITDMISRGIDGVIIDWYGPNNNEDQATKLVMAEAETHPGFTFAIMIDQGAIAKNSCSGCSSQQVLINLLQYVEQTYFPSPAYMTQQGKPVVTNFDIDLNYTVDWTVVNATLSTQPVYLFQNNSGFTHVLSDGSYAWVMPTTSDYGMSYLTSFYDTGLPLASEQTMGAVYKGFNDSMASWGSNRVMGQQCGQTWLQTFSEINGLYNSGRQLADLQLVTWNDYEEATEIESGISNCFTVSAAVSGSSLQWAIQGDGTTVDHYVAYISTDGQNLMPLGDLANGPDSVNLCSYSIPNGSYTLFVQAVGKPTIANQISGPVKFTSNCAASATGTTTVALGTNPSSMTISSGGSGNITVTATAQSGAFNNAIALSCSGLPVDLTCSFSPASVTPGAGAVNSVLTVSSATVAGANHHERNHPLLAIGLFGCGLFGLTLVGSVQRKRVGNVLGVCVLAAMIAGVTSCGGNAASGNVTGGNPGGGSGGTTVTTSNAASYTVTVNGSSSSVQLSTTVTVTVQ